MFPRWWNAGLFQIKSEPNHEESDFDYLSDDLVNNESYSQPFFLPEYPSYDGGYTKNDNATRPKSVRSS
jgi:hypothetical protein